MSFFDPFQAPQQQFEAEYNITYTEPVTTVGGQKQGALAPRPTMPIGLILRLKEWLELKVSED